MGNEPSPRVRDFARRCFCPSALRLLTVSCNFFFLLNSRSGCSPGRLVTSVCDALQWNPAFWDVAPPFLRCHFTVLSCVLYQKVKNELLLCIISALVSYFVKSCVNETVISLLPLSRGGECEST